jgi:hypothetical protein
VRLCICISWSGRRRLRADGCDRRTRSIWTGANEAQRVSDVMNAAWIAVARYGTPMRRASPPAPPFTAQHRETMVFNVVSRAVNDPLHDERVLPSRLLRRSFGAAIGSGLAGARRAGRCSSNWTWWRCLAHSESKADGGCAASLPPANVKCRACAHSRGGCMKTRGAQIRQYILSHGARISCAFATPESAANHAARRRVFVFTQPPRERCAP